MLISQIIMDDVRDAQWLYIIHHKACRTMLNRGRNPTPAENDTPPK